MQINNFQLASADRMIHQIWHKKVPAIIEMNSSDVADDIQPIPLVMQISWNHYIGHYFQMINDFFFSYLPFPVNQKQFWLELKQLRVEVKPTQIVSIIISLNNLDMSKPITFVAHFRSQKQQQEIELQRFYKNSLKASTAMRYGKDGAKRLTFNMSVNNVKSMYSAFDESNIQKYLGSNNFQSDDLGYSFLIASSDIVPIKIISNNFLIERKSQKEQSLKHFLIKILQPQDNQIRYQKIFSILPIKLHNIPMIHGEILIKDLEKYCHPDGYLYFTL